MKKLLSITLALLLTFALTVPALAAELKPVKIGATPSPHAEILEFIKPAMAAEGFDLQITVFNDYIIPNTAVENNELDANYFQHIAYLEDFNANNKTHLVPAIGVHFEPMGIFPGKTAKLEEMKDGATIAVPNDPTNEARALLLLEAQGVLTLKPDAGVSATKLDILENPKKVQIMEMEAAQLPRVLADVDFAVINGNYALAAGLSATKDAVAAEGSDALVYATRVNYVVVKEGNEEADFVKALEKVLSSKETIDFIMEKYQGAVIPSLATDAAK
ncbi:MAG: MetQ/NlpA family ABC transporter substrate-binding protein [Clostridia bacterium]